MQRDLIPLWSLLEACRDGSPEQQRRSSELVADELRKNGAMRVELRCAILSVDDYPVVSSADRYAATHGLRRIFRDAGTARVDLSQDASPEALCDWAVATVEGGRQPTSAPGIEVVAAAPQAGPEAPTPTSPSASRLASVFSQQQLIAALPPLPGVLPAAAKAVIEASVERLLDEDSGLEPLVLLQSDDALLARSAAVAVLAVVLARAAGWPLDRLSELGVAGLLHDLGVALDPDAPAEASFRWLLRRGCDDLWLRAALVARGWRERGDDAAELGAVAVVRLAAAVQRGGLGEVRRMLSAGLIDADLAEVAVRAVAA